MKRNHFIVFCLAVGLVFALLISLKVSEPAREQKTAQKISLRSLPHRPEPKTPIEAVADIGETVVNQTETDAPPDFGLLADAVKKGNKAEIKNALQMLAPFLENHPEKVVDVLAALQRTGMDMLDVNALLIEANNENPTGAGNNLIVRAALDAASGENPSDKKLAALSQLKKVFEGQGGGQMRNIVPISNESVESLSQIISSDTDSRVRLAALDSAANWVDKNPNILSALSQKLAQALNASDDETIHARALQLLGESAKKTMGLPDQTLLAMSDLIWKEKTEANRALMAQSFSGATGGAVESVLSKLEKAFYEQSDTNTKKIILNQMIAIGKGRSMDGKNRSVEILQRIPANDALATDVQNLLQTLQQESPADVAIQK